MNGTIAKVCTLTLPTLVCAILTTFACMLTGCGKKNMPKPPKGNRPPQVTDLAYTISESSIKLSWTIPETSNKAKSPASGFLIYRSMQSASEANCTNCPVTFLKIGDVPIRGGVAGKPEAEVVFVQPIEPDYRYRYKVKAYDDDGVVGQDSNLIDFTHKSEIPRQ